MQILIRQKYQKCYGGVRLLGDGPSLANVERLDGLAMPMISAMQATGLQVDLSHFARMEKELKRDMDRITEEVRTMVGTYVNIDSGDQVADMLFKRLGLKQARVKMTKGGDRESTENEVLVAIQHEHPVVPKILDYKELSKLLGTYVRPMPRLAKKVAPGEWRMFPNFKTTRVPSGRLSCSDPNLLAMPTRTERGKEVRKGFITKDDWVILSVDQSQIEPRIATYRSADPNLVRVYTNSEDIYSDFAIAAFQLKDERYQDETGTWIYPHVLKMDHRYPAKTCILAAIYDVTGKGLLEQMPVVCKNCKKAATLHDCGRFESLWHEGNCQDILNKFYITYPYLLKMRKTDHSTARKHGLIWDMWGRILHVAAVHSVLDWVVSKALREVGNFPVQSGAQGSLKISMAEVWDGLVASNYLDVVQVLLQVHDELIFACRRDVAEEVGVYVKGVFENCVRLNIPIKAAMETASTWGDLKK